MTGQALENLFFIFADKLLNIECFHMLLKVFNLFVLLDFLLLLLL